MLDATDSVHKKILPTNLGHRFVYAGAAANLHFGEGSGTPNNITSDGNWHDMDCSGTVPAGAVAIMFSIKTISSTPNDYFYMCNKGDSASWSVQRCQVMVANIAQNAMFIMPCDANQVVEYSTSNIAWTVLYIVILGWWI